MSAAKITWIPISAALVVALVVIACSDDNQESREEGAVEEDISLRELVTKARAGEYHVTYDVKDAEGAEGQITVAVKDDKTFVEANFGEGPGTEGGIESISIDDGSTSYSCGDTFGLLSEGEEGGEVCYGAPSSQENDIPSLRDFFNPVGLAEGLASAGQAEADGTESIAGQDVRCFKVNTLELSGRVCVEEELGVPLLLEGTDPDDASFSWRATELRDEVDDSVFEPPYEVKDYPVISPSE
jgi:hypothetical protein